MNPSQQTCPRCGYLTTVDAPFCTECGFSFTSMLRAPQSGNYDPYASYNPSVQPHNANQLPYSGPPMYPVAPPNQPTAYGMQYQVPPVYAPKNKVAAALFAFFLGGFGIHGFYLGNNAMGLTLLIITIVSIPLSCIIIGFFGFVAVGLISLAQTILYLIADDAEFYQKYVVEKRWF